MLEPVTVVRGLGEALRLPALHLSHAHIATHLPQWIIGVILLVFGLTVAFVGHKYKGM
jgi:hypothetical protein